VSNTQEQETVTSFAFLKRRWYDRKTCRRRSCPVCIRSALRCGCALQFRYAEPTRGILAFRKKLEPRKARVVRAYNEVVI
jgi:hypothetical protein